LCVATRPNATHKGKMVSKTGFVPRKVAEPRKIAKTILALRKPADRLRRRHGSGNMLALCVATRPNATRRVKW
jgi:hypothetical protein